jgi:hypothetical protein
MKVFFRTNISSQEELAVRSDMIEDMGYPFVAEAFRHYVYEGPVPYQKFSVNFWLDLLRMFQDECEGPVERIFYHIIDFEKKGYYDY